MIRANGKVPNGYVIHHKNHDKEDNRLENLEKMKEGQHIRHHRIWSIFKK